MRKYFYLVKEDFRVFYLKSVDTFGVTLTTSLSQAMRFENKPTAVEFNHEKLHGEYNVVLI